MSLLHSRGKQRNKGNKRTGQQREPGNRRTGEPGNKENRETKGGEIVISFMNSKCKIFQRRKFISFRIRVGNMSFDVRRKGHVDAHAR